MSYITPLHYAPFPPSTYCPPYPPPYTSPPSYLHPVLGIDPPATTTSMSPVLPATVRPPDIITVFDESQHTGQWCSGGGERPSPPPIGPPPPLLHSEVSNTTSLPCIASYEFLPDEGPPCGGIHQVSARSWGSLPRSHIQTRWLPERPPCKNFRRYGGLPPPTPKSGRNVLISSVPSKNWQLIPTSYIQMR